MLGRLEAEESLLAYHRTALGSGSMDKEAAMGLLKAWEIDANGGVAPRRAVQKATPADMRAMGFGVRRVPRTTPPTTES